MNNNYDSSYSIINHIIANNGGEIDNFDSVYSQALYLCNLLGAEVSETGSTYDVLNGLITFLGGTVSNFDSVYTQLLYIAELLQIEVDDTSNYDILYSLKDATVTGWGGLKFTALAETPVYYQKNDTTNTCEYSLDGGSTWQPLTTTPVTLQTGDEMCLKGTITSDNTQTTAGHFAKFVIPSGSIKASGNIMSMMYGDDFADKLDTKYIEAFFGLFISCYITDAEELELPATTLSNMCYMSLFDSAKLTKMPKVLPATTIPEGAYSCMFRFTPLTAITTTLPATTLGDGAYYYMFYSCSSITQSVIEELPALVVPTDGYKGMFYKCKFQNPPHIKATKAGNNAMQQMFSQNEFTTAPAIDVVEAANETFANMFYGCTNLVDGAVIHLPSVVATGTTDTLYRVIFRLYNGCTKLERCWFEATDIPTSAADNYGADGLFNGTSQPITMYHKSTDDWYMTATNVTQVQY